MKNKTNVSIKKKYVIFQREYARYHISYRYNQLDVINMSMKQLTLKDRKARDFIN